MRKDIPLAEEEHSEREYINTAHLMVLFCETFFGLILIAEDIFLGWERWVIPLIIFELVICWWLHLAQSFTPVRRLRFYATTEWITFFFYGVHQTSFYDLSSVMVVIMLIFTMTGELDIVYSGMVTYYLTILYDLIFVPGDRFSLTILNVTRILLHIAVITLAGLISRSMILRRRMQERGFRDQIAILEEMNQQTEDFLTNVSHELRTPINAVMGISSVLYKSENDSKRKRSLRSIREAGVRLSDQVGDILDHTEINTGRLTISEDEYMISSVVNDLLTEIRGASGDVDMLFDIAADVPSVLKGDVRKVKKIIRHLVENSLKFTKDGAVYIGIGAFKKPYGVNLLIRVSDTGIGISESEVEQITEQFYQTNSGRSRSAGGLGLGLSIVAGLTTAMEGFLTIKSKPDDGTSVYVTIPQRVVDEAPCLADGDLTRCVVAYYDRPETYQITRVWEFYNDLVNHLAQGLKITVHRVTDIAQLEALKAQTSLTHVFMGWAEYNKDMDYFNRTADDVNIVVAVDDFSRISNSSGIHFIKTPLSSFSVLKALAGSNEIIDFKSTENKQMICPGVSVLVVDDEVMNLVVARGIFKDYQLTVATAESGEEAIRLCREHTYDIIFMDHMMPGMDGVEAKKYISGDDPDHRMKIVALTANAVSGAREMFFNEGFDEFIAKPLENRELERVLKKLLPSSSIRYIESTHPSITDALPKEQDKPVRARSNPTLESLEKTGLNVTKGIEYCMGHEDMYISLLKIFVEDAIKMTDELLDDSAMASDTVARRTAIETTARLLGADAIAGQVWDISLDELCNNIKELSDSIDRILSHKASDSKKDESSLMNTWLGLGEALRTYEANRALDCLALIRDGISSEYKVTSVLDELEGKIKNYEFTAALNLFKSTELSDTQHSHLAENQGE